MSREDDFTDEDVSRLLLEVMGWVYGGGPLTPDETAVLDRVRAALAAPKQEQPKPNGYAYRYSDCIRFNGGNTVNGELPIEALPYWFAPPADIDALRRENERLQVALAEANTVREACNQRAFRLEAEIERLRKMLMIIRDIDDECKRDGLQTISTAARNFIDDALRREGET